MEFFHDIEWFATISFLIPLIPGWILFRKLPGEFKLFICIISIVFILSYIGYYTSEHNIHNLAIYNLLYVFQFYSYSLLFRKLLPSNSSIWFIRIIAILFTIYIAVKIRSLVFPNEVYNSYLPAFMSLAMILYCILFFNSQLGNLQTTFIYKTPWFWIVTGLLLYFSGSFLILLVTNYFMSVGNNFVRSLWILLFLFGIIKCLLMGIGFLYVNKTSWKKSF